MVKSWTLRALMALAGLFTARSLCDDVTDYLNVPVPLGGDVMIGLDLRRVYCPEVDESEDLEEIIVTGGTLTLSSVTTVRFVNLRFTVEDGASLIFDMPKTQFGPNSGSRENAPGFLVDVKQGGSVEFLGEFGGREVDNVRSMFYNAGTMEFKGDALFQGNGNVFRSNSGTLKFRGDATFRDNLYLPIDNIGAGYVRFSKLAIFEHNGFAFDGGNGCAIGNHDSQGKVVFRGYTKFSDHSCDYAGAVYNVGKMRFYGLTYFNDNRSQQSGGAVDNHTGSLIFKGAVQFNRNQADNDGGGLSVRGGEVIFQRGVWFNGNDVYGSGAAFSVTFGDNYENGAVIYSDYGSLTFGKSSKTKFNGNTIASTSVNQDIPACTVGYVVDGATLEGYPDEDVCVDKFL